MISIFPIPNVPILESKEQFWETIKLNLNLLKDNDVLVLAHTPWSRIEGPIYDIEHIKPSEKALEIALTLDKDPRHVEVILKESKEVVKFARKVLVTENIAGIVCANAGIDQSNAGLGKMIAVPHDPDKIAQMVRKFILDEGGITVGVIISDTVGRALRKGAVNIGIGCAGIQPMRSEIGRKDLFGYTMRVSQVALIDEIASAAELVQGQTDEGCPFVVVRGIDYESEEDVTARDLNRPKEERIFS